jgi:hypothetical protein
MPMGLGVYLFVCPRLSESLFANNEVELVAHAYSSTGSFTPIYNLQYNSDAKGNFWADLRHLGICSRIWTLICRVGGLILAGILLYGQTSTYIRGSEGK